MAISFKMAIIRPNGEIDILIRTKYPTLPEMQDFVGGYLEEIPTVISRQHDKQVHVRIQHDPHPSLEIGEGPELQKITTQFYRPVVFADEEGLMKKLPFNDLGSALCGRELVGTILVIEINPEDEEG